MYNESVLNAILRYRDPATLWAKYHIKFEETPNQPIKPFSF